MELSDEAFLSLILIEITLYHGFSLILPMTFNPPLFFVFIASVRLSNSLVYT
jgi:hypothetical protein